MVHIQWAGINTNVAGRAGEGKDSTDRNNFVELSGDPDTSYPYILSKATFCNNVVSLMDPSSSGHNIAISLASSSYFCGKAASKTCPAGITVDGNNCAALQKQLDNAPASYFGHVVAFNSPSSPSWLRPHIVPTSSTNLTIKTFLTSYSYSIAQLYCIHTLITSYCSYTFYSNPHCPVGSVGSAAN